ncbi:MAG: methyltransferase domain-containing protein [Chloroflexi bacterium]|nr:methyltransferase domain-containing protein [Chloroflexota bacterium]
MPLLPNFLERFLFITLNAAPAPAFEIFSAISFRVVLAAIRLGVFDALAAQPQTLSEIARATNSSERGIAILLDALVTIGYVTRTGDRYALSRMTQKWLTRGAGKASVAPAFRFFGTLLTENFETLEETIRAGKTGQDLYAALENQPELSRDFQDWMVAIANTINSEVLSKLKILPHARRVLDIGGGHGWYSIALCQKYPYLNATIFDFPQPLTSARANIAAEKMETRIQTRTGDFLRDDFGAGYDVALVFNIVHGLSAEQNRDLLRRAHAALNRGGVIAIIEQMATNVPSPIGRAINAMLHLSFFHLIGGGIYSFDDLAAWLTATGFSNVRRSDFLRAPGSSLVTATKN